MTCDKYDPVYPVDMDNPKVLVLSKVLMAVHQAFRPHLDDAMSDQHRYYQNREHNPDWMDDVNAAGDRWDLLHGIEQKLTVFLVNYGIEISKDDTI